MSACQRRLITSTGTPVGYVLNLVAIFGELILKCQNMLLLQGASNSNRMHQIGILVERHPLFSTAVDKIYYPFHIKPIMRSQMHFENNAVWCECSEAALFDSGVRKAAFYVGGLLHVFIHVLPREVFWKRILAKAAVCDGAVVNVKGCIE